MTMNFTRGGGGGATSFPGLFKGKALGTRLGGGCIILHTVAAWLARKLDSRGGLYNKVPRVSARFSRAKFKSPKKLRGRERTL